MAKIPFTMYAQIYPEYGNGKRFEIQRSRERIAWLIQKNLIANFSDGNIALPGGGGYATVVDRTTADDGFSTHVDIVAVKPQFGNDPDMVTVTGFVDTELIGESDDVPYPSMNVISGNEYHSGPATGAPGWTVATEPTTDNEDLVVALKSALEAAITDVTVLIIKMEVNGVLYGRGGYHFPV